ncbi:MAG: 50S ribosomal protein L25 [Patescibacteria group bacterium]|mgnify:CR=1 FL=1
MKKHTLIVTKRESLGRKVKKLRVAGQIPATVYGKNVKSVSVSVLADAFAHTYDEVGETGLVDLSVEGSIRPVLIHNVQKDPVTWSILHVEFHQVDLKVKVRANVPLVTIGESPAVTQKKGVVLHILDEIEVEALPTDLPEKIEVDVGGLIDVNAEVQVGDLRIPKGVTVLSDSALTVVKIGSLVTREAEAEAAAEAAKAAEVAAASAEGEAGEAKKTEGEASADLPAGKAGKPQAEKEDLPAGKAGKKSE